MSLMLPRYVIDPNDPTAILDRWEEGGEITWFSFNTQADARHAAREMENKIGRSMLICVADDDAQILPIIPCTFFSKEGAYYVHVYDLQEGEPSKPDTWFRDIPLADIKAWDL